MKSFRVKTWMLWVTLFVAVFLLGIFRFSEGFQAKKPAPTKPAPTKPAPAKPAPAKPAPAKPAAKPAVKPATVKPVTSPLTTVIAAITGTGSSSLANTAAPCPDIPNTSDYSVRSVSDKELELSCADPRFVNERQRLTCKEKTLYDPEDPDNPYNVSEFARYCKGQIKTFDRMTSGQTSNKMVCPTPCKKDGILYTCMDMNTNTESKCNFIP